MWFHEHLDRLTKYYSQKDLSVPFINANSILKKIESRFIYQKRVVDDLNALTHHHNYWFNDMKRKVEVTSLAYGHIYDWIERLDMDTNYWMVITFGEASKHMVFNCKPWAMASLYAVSGSDFFVIDKKYKWLACFDADVERQEFVFYRSGDALTDFEIKHNTLIA